MIEPATSLDAGHPHGSRCAARSKQTGQPCGRWPSPGRTVCYYHGGRTPVGVLAPPFQHGRYSKHLPTRLLERFEEAQADPDRLTYADEIALQDTRISDLLARCQSGESGAAWKAITRSWRDFKRFKTAGNTARQDEALEQLSEALDRGLSDHACWSEIGEAVDRRARLVVLESARVKELEATLSVTEAMGLLGVVVDTLRRHLDEATLQKVGADLEQLVAFDSVPLAARSRRHR